MTSRHLINVVTGILAASGMLAATTHHAKAEELNVYNWSDNIAEDTVSGFEKETGIHARYDVYDGDDTLQAKLLSGSSGYDVVVPSSAYAGKQIEAGVYRKLDKSKIPNLANLEPVLMKMLASADPGNQYTVPWSWGTDGIGYNVTKVMQILGKDAPFDSWDLLFDPQYLSKLKSCGVSVLDSPEDAFSVGLIYLHKDPNSTNPADYQAVYKLFKTIRPYITQFNAYEIRYVIPKGDGVLWFDLMGVPKDAPHPEAAMQWINYILQPKVSAAITNQVYYPNANAAARAYVKPAILDNEAVYPRGEKMQSLTPSLPLPTEILLPQNRLWTQLKAGR